METRLLVSQRNVLFCPKRPLRSVDCTLILLISRTTAPTVTGVLRRKMFWQKKEQNRLYICLNKQLCTTKWKLRYKIHYRVPSNHLFSNHFPHHCLISTTSTWHSFSVEPDLASIAILVGHNYYTSFGGIGALQRLETASALTLR